MIVGFSSVGLSSAWATTATCVRLALMARNRIYHDKQPAGSVRHTASGKRVVARNSETGQFVIGRDAFGKVSEVEGIVVSRRLKADLRRLESASPEKRRSVLSEKYGKK
jgi:hypothetical protein